MIDVHIVIFMVCQLAINAFLGWWVWRLERRLVVVEVEKESK